MSGGLAVLSAATQAPGLWELLVEPWLYDFMRRALLVTVVAAVVCAVLSCWLVLIGWSLMGDAVAHAVLPGVVLAYLVGAPFAVGAFLFGIGAVALIGGVRESTRLKGDTAIGVVFTAIFAFGVVLVSTTPSQVDLSHILFGNVLGVSDGDLVQVLVLAAVVLGVLVVLRHDITLWAFDRVHAHVIGMPVRRTGAVVLGALALTVVVALQAVGVVLATAMLITPGATAFLLAPRLRHMLLLAPLLAAVSAVVGVWASYLLDAASAGLVVVCQGLIFALAWAWTRVRARAAAPADHPSAGDPAAGVSVDASPGSSS